MDLQDLSTIYTCFIVGGFVIPVLNVAVGAVGGAFHIGADVDVDLDVDADLDLDTDLDVDAGPDALHPGGSSPIPVNLMTLSFTAVVLGAVGRLCVATGVPVPLGAGLAVLCGVAAGALLGRFVLLPLKRNRANATLFRRLKGTEAVVKLEIRDDFVGTISLPSALGSIVTYSARPAPGFHRLPIGEKVIIVGIDEEKEICVVQPLCDIASEETIKNKEEQQTWNT